MLVIERQRVILEQVRRKGVITVRDAARTLGANEVTVRRDLTVLARSGLIKRTRGGAVLPTGFGRKTVQQEQRATPAPEAIAIAIEAANLVGPGDSVILGAGIATLALARELTEVENLTVVTNSLLICEALVDAPGVDLFLTGGSVQRSTMTLVGPSVEHSLRGLRTSIAFLSGDGLTALHGLSTSNLMVATADRLVAAVGGRIVALVERPKIGFVSLCQILPCRSIELVITNTGADFDELDRIKEVGVEVRTAVVDVNGPEWTNHQNAPGASSLYM